MIILKKSIYITTPLLSFTAGQLYNLLIQEFRNNLGQFFNKCVTFVTALRINKVKIYNFIVLQQVKIQSRMVIFQKTNSKLSFTRIRQNFFENFHILLTQLNIQLKFSYIFNDTFQQQNYNFYFLKFYCGQGLSKILRQQNFRENFCKQTQS
eukprot:TRINITY_DN2110_c2_g1_i2.p2 TRINITY_DN2110_c2_g1~~TRINITY_DN2110_c2_g1_i2.p2  ORF type:complete len:152 (-),score=3.51 TRINITY_DN2110_c2_g1_i2:117-572(-)